MNTILCIGAHPDDNEINVGGLATRLAARGDSVRFVSVTNGNKGHFAPEYVADPQKLVARRQAEAEAAAARIGASYETLNVPDGEVYVDSWATEAMVRCLRRHRPDLVLFNRPLDYHRDHRYTSQLVLDAAYLLTVPMMCPEVPHLERMPALAYWYDDFRDLQPFRADVLIGIDDVFETKVDMVAEHASQFFEWLPFNAGVLHEVPPDAEGRRARVAANLRRRGEHRRKMASAARLQPSGEFALAEAFQLCEYGRKPTDDEMRDLFALGAGLKAEK